MTGEPTFPRKRGVFFFLFIFTIIIISVYVIADPVGTGTLTPTNSERGTDPSAGQLDIQGGNVTGVSDIVSESVTAKWAGFYGNVSGGITLEDGSGNNFYNWTTTNPDGEVYATRDSNPTWGSIACASAGNVVTESTELILSSGSDNITNTFCETCGNHSAFGVGSTPFTADECTYRTNAYSGSGSQTTNWDQVLLYEGSNIVYTTIIDQNTVGYNGNTYDFQLLIGENSSTSTLTTYYFFVEI